MLDVRLDRAEGETQDVCYLPIRLPERDQLSWTRQKLNAGETINRNLLRNAGAERFQSQRIKTELPQDVHTLFPEPALERAETIAPESFADERDLAELVRDIL